MVATTLVVAMSTEGGFICAECEGHYFFLSDADDCSGMQDWQCVGEWHNWNVYLLGANTSVGVNLAGVSSVYLRNANGLSSTLACDHASHAQRPDLLTTKQKMILSCMQSASLLMCMGTCLLNLFDREDASAACLMLLQDDQQHLSAALSACVSVRRCLVVTYLPACLPIYSVHSEVHLCIVSNLNHSTWNSAVHVTWLSNWSQKVGLQHLRSF